MASLDLLPRYFIELQWFKINLIRRESTLIDIKKIFAEFGFLREGEEA